MLIIITHMHHSHDLNLKHTGGTIGIVALIHYNVATITYKTRALVLVNAYVHGACDRLGLYAFYLQMCSSYRLSWHVQCY